MSGAVKITIRHTMEVVLLDAIDEKWSYAKTPPLFLKLMRADAKSKTEAEVIVD
jgi:hypothetical protein